jgi:hypothetical protein
MLRSTKSPQGRDFTFQTFGIYGWKNEKLKSSFLILNSQLPTVIPSGFNESNQKSQRDDMSVERNQIERKQKSRRGLCVTCVT